MGRGKNRITDPSPSNQLLMQNNAKGCSKAVPQSTFLLCLSYVFLYPMVFYSISPNLRIAPSFIHKSFSCSLSTCHGKQDFL